MSLVIYTTSITLPPKQRSLQEHLIRTLSSLRIPYTVCDVSMDDDGKRLWRRKGRTDGKLPGFLVDGEYVGTLEEYEYAVEDGRVREFLGLDAASSAAAPDAPTAAPPLTTTASTAKPAEEAVTAPLARPRSAPRVSAARDDEVDGILQAAGEDELEKLLRELEGN